MTAPDTVERFIARWQGQEGGQERANYALFLSELCDILDVKRPDPAGANTENNDYVFERAVKRPDSDGRPGLGRIDLYKRGSFVLEANHRVEARAVDQTSDCPRHPLSPPRCAWARPRL